MRHVLFAAAALAIGGFVASTVADAQTFQGGSPGRIGNLCKVATDANGDMDNYGYYEPCGRQARAQAPAREIAPTQVHGFQGGSPARVGTMCKVATDLNGDMDNYGYYAPCGR